MPQSERVCQTKGCEAVATLAVRTLSSPAGLQTTLFLREGRKPVPSVAQWHCTVHTHELLGDLIRTFGAQS